MQLFVLGLNHKSAPVEVRERLSLSSSRLAQALQSLRSPGPASASAISEAAILSTCNRAEFYVLGTSEAGAQLERFVCEHLAPGADIERHLYRLQGAEAARHLLRVASGLDSLVLGESEILGQVKSALAFSREAQCCGPVLDELFRRAIGGGKRVRTETAIGRGALNVGSAAVELARKILGPLTGHTVLILGAGKMSSLTAQHLVASGARRILVANRTYERAAELADLFTHRDARDTSSREMLAGIPGAEAQAVAWDEFPRRLVEADIVISSTRAPHLVLTHEHIAAAMRARHGRPLFLIDIAVPRDIDPRAHQVEDVFLYDIDDLGAVVESNRKQRGAELGRAGAIVEEEVLAWQKWMLARASSPVASALARHAAQLRDQEVEAALAQLGHLSERDQAIVAALGRALSGKLMHAPLRHLREGAEQHPGDAAALARAFSLPGQASEVAQGASSNNGALSTWSARCGEEVER